MTHRDDEDQWVRELLDENDRLEHERWMQPGRGHRYRYKQDSDWWILALVVIFIIAGYFG